MMSRIGASERMQLSVACFTLLLLAVLLAWIVKPIAAPRLHSAIYLPEPTPIRPFSLLNHHNKTFTQHDLLGRWSLLSYGYTYCPDICPTALSTLVKFERLFNPQKEGEAVSLLFYTVDPQRDSADQLKQYLDFFPAPFLGLTAGEETSRDSLEKDLGILVNIQQQGDESSQVYKVSHGMMMYLINPQGRLQAVFKPSNSKGVAGFESKVLYSDYKAIRQFVSEG